MITEKLATLPKITQRAGKLTQNAIIKYNISKLLTELHFELHTTKQKKKSNKRRNLDRNRSNMVCGLSKRWIQDSTYYMQYATAAKYTYAKKICICFCCHYSCDCVFVWCLARHWFVVLKVSVHNNLLPISNDTDSRVFSWERKSVKWKTRYRCYGGAWHSKCANILNIHTMR